MSKTFSAAFYLFERMFVPRVMRATYPDEFERLDAYAREHRPT